MQAPPGVAEPRKSSADPGWLVEVIKKDKTEWRDYALQSLQNLALNGEGDRLIEMGAVAPLVKIATTESGPSQELASRVIQALSVDTDYAVLMVRTYEILPALVSAGQNVPAENLGVRVSVLGILHNLASASDNRELMCEPGIVGLVLDALAVEGDGVSEKKLRTNASGLLWTLSEHPPNAVALVRDHSVLAPVVACLAAGRGDQDLLLHVLENCSRPKENKDGAGPDLLAPLHAYLAKGEQPGSGEGARTEKHIGETRRCVLTTLHELSGNHANLAAMANNDGLLKLVCDVAGSGSGSDAKLNGQGARQSACSVLYKLMASDEHGPALLKKGQAGDGEGSAAIVPALLKALDEEDDNVVAFASAALHHVVLHAGPQGLAAHEQVLQGFVKTLASDKPASVKQSACGVLQQLLGDDSARLGFVQAGGLDAVLALLEADPNVKILEYGMAILCGLAFSEQAEVKAALKNNERAIGLAVDILEGSKNKIKEFSCSLLLGLSFGDTKKELIVEKALSPLIDSLLEGKLNKKSVDSSLRLIHNLASKEFLQERLVGEYYTLKVVVVLMRRGLDEGGHLKHAEMGVAILHTLAVNEEVQGALGAVDDLLETVVRVLVHEKTSERAKASAVATLSAISTDEDSVDQFADSLQVIADSIINAKDETMRLQSLKLLHNLRDLRVQIAISEIPAQLLMLLLASNSDELTEHLTRALCALSFVKMGTWVGEAIAEEHLDCFAKLVASENEATKTAALGLVWAASSEPNLQPLLMENFELSEALVAVLKSATGKQLTYACLIFQTLARVESNRDALVEEHNAVEGLLHVVKEHKGKARQLALTTLRLLPVHETEMEEVMEQVLADAGLPMWRKGSMGMAPEDDQDDLASEVGSVAASEADVDMKEFMANQMFNHCTLVMKEMESTERIYVKALQDMGTIFETPLKAMKKAKKLNVEGIFHNIPPILATHQAFHEKLKAIVGDSERENWASEIAGAITETAPFMKQSSPYIDNFDAMMKIVDKVMKDKKAKKIFEKAKTQTNLNLQSYLIMPIQRIPRIELLLRDMMKNIDKQHPDHAKLKKAMGEIKAVAQHCNERKREAETSHALSIVAIRIVDLPKGVSVVANKRKFVCEGRLRILHKEGKSVLGATFFLFNNTIIWGVDKNAHECSYKGHIDFEKKRLKVLPSLASNEIQDIKTKLSKGLRRKAPIKINFDLGFVVTNGKVSRTLFASSVEQKDEWVTKIRTAPKA